MRRRDFLSCGTFQPKLRSRLTFLLSFPFSSYHPFLPKIDFLSFLLCRRRRDDDDGMRDDSTIYFLCLSICFRQNFCSGHFSLNVCVYNDNRIFIFCKRCTFIAQGKKESHLSYTHLTANFSNLNKISENGLFPPPFFRYHLRLHN